MIIAYDQLNRHIHQLFIGVTDADPTPGPEETAAGKEEAREVPPGLEEWIAEGAVQIMFSESVRNPTFVDITFCLVS